MPTPAFPVSAFAALALAAGLLGACGGDDDGSDNRCTLQTVIPDGGVITRLFADPSLDTFAAAYSPDGMRLAFMYRKDDGPREIAVANADGSNLRVVTSRGKTSYLPRWSPDGQSLVFLSQEGEDTSTADLYVVGADGTGERRLTDDEYWDYVGDWSKDSAVILFGSERPDGWHVMTMAPDGSGQANLPVDAQGNAGSWSPDGRRIAFTSDRDGNDDIWVMAADGKDQQNLTKSPAHDDNPRWSPDGESIVFASDRSGSGQIWVISADGSGAKQITSDETAVAFLPDWSLGGDRIVYATCPPTD